MKRWQSLILILALSACATAPGDVADESLGAPEKVCVNVRNITSFDAIDDRHIYIKARGEQKHFLGSSQRLVGIRLLCGYGSQAAH